MRRDQLSNVSETGWLVVVEWMQNVSVVLKAPLIFFTEVVVHIHLAYVNLGRTITISAPVIIEIWNLCHVTQKM